ncbi:MAG TPA: DegT/DnrJ/EryC1/StrS family aminotransferase [Gemmatimonadaceae bacterium]|nr:DegT/DnrJ/EryC1/StrS family aminotransferase [Gemmatimonadaceae bacterium]
MIGRHQLPVSSPIALGALARSAGAALARPADGHDRLRTLLRGRFGARAAALADSGTSALALALRLAVGEGGTVAFPGYACIDLAAAARLAGVRVRLYDLDPATLSPDLASVEATLRRGARAVVVAHLYGLPADVPGVAAIAAAHGAAVIEDAAQGAGGALRGTLLGGFGALTVLSFGRGKGTTGGRGGALLAITPEWEEPVRAAGAALGAAPPGWRDLAGAAAQWALGRPTLYGLPSAIPSLRLGEMVYHPAHEPAPLSAAAARLVRSAFEALPADLAVRRRNAERLRAAARGTRIRVAEEVEGGENAWLRLPARVPEDAPMAPRLGVFRGYPLTLFEMAELHPCLHEDERDHPGALELRRTLATLPTHAHLTGADLDALAAWMRRI